MDQQTTSSLINEAIKRILLDIVIRGHGDRLIGRWSREPEIQRFLDQVPYMLDRINQLHLVCTRTEPLELDHVHHYHQHQHQHHSRGESAFPLGRTALTDFISLIGNDMHWLVRTRDPLGLSPLHKSVLFNNRAIAEYIVDRYQDELAATSWPVRRGAKPKAREGSGVIRLINAQDKYGRTPLHYAAALISTNNNHDKYCNGERHKQQQHYAGSRNQLYHFLISKDASQDIQDFRGKTPPYYLHNPQQLHSKSVIHLANKLNASFQANVLNKTLKASREQRPPFSKHGPHEQLIVSTNLNSLIDEVNPEANRQLMSQSYNDLSQCNDDDSTAQLAGNSNILRARSNSSIEQKLANGDQHSSESQKLSKTNGYKPTTRNTNTNTNKTSIQNVSIRESKLSIADDRDYNEDKRADSSSFGWLACSLLTSDASDAYLDESSSHSGNLEQAYKNLIADRNNRLKIDQQTKQNLLRSLNEGVLDRITELLIEGYGQVIVDEASISCWNLQCKRYVSNIIPNLLKRLDLLHESIAKNQFDKVKNILHVDPILARMRRPYRRASMNALQIAIHLERMQIIRYLIDHFPESALQRDSNGATSLHWAARSLRLERLYCWLLENFEPQLEQVRDSKGRSAFDYRQQAIRLAKYGERHPIPNQRVNDSKDARDFLQASETESSKLNCTGKKTNLEARKSIRKKQPQPQPQQPSVKDKSALAKPANLMPSGNIAIVEQDDGSPNVLLSNQGEKTNPTPADNDDNISDRTIDVKSPESSSSNNNFPSSTLMMMSPSPDSTSLNPRKLESTLLNAIENDNLKTLENLILAGRGQKIVDFHRKLSEAKASGDQEPSSGVRISDKMRDFIENRTPALMKSIEQVHDVLHQCFAVHESELESKYSEEQLLRLFNLLSNKRLIMSRDAFGASPLHVAIMRADNRLVEYIIRRQPESVSAPDIVGRNALHYAAIASSISVHHQEVKLTRRIPRQNKNDESELKSGQIAGFWLLNSTVNEIFEKLCARYEELIEVKDRMGATCMDYINKTSQESHVDLTKESAGLLDSQLLSSCCPDYSQMLARYNYMILNQTKVVTAQASNEPTESTQVEESPPQLEQESQTDYHTQNQEPTTTVQEPDITIDDLSMKRTRSCGSADGNRRKAKLPKPSVSGSKTKTTDDLLENISGELMVPIHNNPRYLAVSAKQMAPRPTVGSEAGFPSISRSPTNLDGFNGTQSRGAEIETRKINKDAKSKNGTRNGHTSNQFAGDKLLDSLDPSHLNHARPHKNYHGGVHLRYKGKAHQSIVGGVIVPSTIHDDESGEIETYDIIYRQTSPMNGQRYAISSLMGNDGASDGRGCSSGQQDPSRPSTVGSNISSDDDECNSTDDSDDEDNDEEYNQRVHRLSNEFDDRVTREKNELKAKVDQIMSEIKNTAKPKPLGAGSSSNKVMFALDVGGRGSGEFAPTSLLSNSRQVSGSCSPSRNLSSNGGSPVCTSSSSVSSYTSSQSHTSSDIRPGQRQDRSNSTTSSSSSTLASATRSPNEREPQDDGGKIQQALPKPNTDKPETTNGKSTMVSHRENDNAELGSRGAVSKNAFGQTYLHFIASRPQTSSTLYKILEHAHHLIGERDTFYRTARDVAVQFNLPNNVIVIDEFIIDAFISAKTNLLRNLLNQGYSPLIHVSDPDGNDIMLILKLLKLDKMIQFLLHMADFQRWRDELHTFIRHGYSAGVSELIKKHPDLVKAKSMHARASIHLAVLFDRLDMVEELVRMDPTSIHVTDSMGRTPLHYAYGTSRSQNMLQIREKLIASGSNQEARDVKMRTPKYYAIFKSEIEEIKRIELELN